MIVADWRGGCRRVCGYRPPLHAEARFRSGELGFGSGEEVVFAGAVVEEQRVALSERGLAFFGRALAGTAPAAGAKLGIGRTRVAGTGALDCASMSRKAGPHTRTVRFAGRSASRLTAAVLAATRAAVAALRCSAVDGGTNRRAIEECQADALMLAHVAWHNTETIRPLEVGMKSVGAELIAGLSLADLPAAALAWDFPVS